MHDIEQNAAIRNLLVFAQGKQNTWTSSETGHLHPTPPPPKVEECH